MKAQRGGSLLELLVAQALGMLIMASVLNTLAQGTDQQRQREDRLQVQESAQLIARALRHSLAQSGFVDWSDSGWQMDHNHIKLGAHHLMPGGAPLFACPGDMQGNPAQHAKASPDHLPQCGPQRAQRETLQILHQGLASAAADPRWASDLNVQSAKDCLQQHSGGSPWVVNRFYIRQGTLGWQLLCAGSGNQTAQALAMGVEEWVFRFLVVLADGQSQWVPTPHMGPADAPAWRNVVRIEVCWVINSSEGRRGASHAHRIQTHRPTCMRDNEGQWAADLPRHASDHRLWQRHTQTVALLNTSANNTPP